MRRLWAGLLLAVLLAAGCAPSPQTPFERCGQLWKQGVGAQSGLDRHSWMMNCMDGYEKLNQ